MSQNNQNVEVKKWQWVALGLLFLSFLGLKLWQFHWPKKVIEINGMQLKVLVAKTPEHMYKGLGKRKDLGKYQGMLFVFPELGKHSIVMRDMYFPIDIVWLKNGEIVDFAPNVPLEPGISEADLRKYYPRQEANLVLELPAGWTLTNNVKIGDKISLVK